MSEEDTFSDAPQEGVRGSNEAKELRKAQGNKKGSFTKRFNKFKERVEAKVEASIIKGRGITML